jgi:hypothetical protein
VDEGPDCLAVTYWLMVSSMTGSGCQLGFGRLIPAQGNSILMETYFILFSGPDRSSHLRGATERLKADRVSVKLMNGMSGCPHDFAIIIAFKDGVIYSRYTWFGDYEKIKFDKFVVEARPTSADHILRCGDPACVDRFKEFLFKFDLSVNQLEKNLEDEIDRFGRLASPRPYKTTISFDEAVRSMLKRKSFQHKSTIAPLLLP